LVLLAAEDIKHVKQDVDKSGGQQKAQCHAHVRLPRA
jgi:hypothetical protein